MTQRCLGVLGDHPRPILDNFRLILTANLLKHNYSKINKKNTYFAPYAEMVAPYLRTFEEVIDFYLFLVKENHICEEHIF